MLVGARNEDLVFASSMSTKRGVAIHSGKRRRKVDGGIGSGLDEFDILPRSPSNKGMHRGFQLDGIDGAFELQRACQLSVLGHA